MIQGGGEEKKKAKRLWQENMDRLAEEAVEQELKKQNLQTDASFTMFQPQSKETAPKGDIFILN